MGQFSPMLSFIGTTIGAYGAYQQGQAEAGAAHYNAAINRQNAAISRANAEIVEQSGQAQVGLQGQKTRAIIADTTAKQAASGVDVSSGSFTDIRSSERQLGELDAMTLRSHAAREAYGYRNKATSEETQGILSDFEGKNASVMGGINAASTFLSGAGTAASEYQKYQLEAAKTMSAA